MSSRRQRAIAAWIAAPLILCLAAGCAATPDAGGSQPQAAQDQTVGDSSRSACLGRFLGDLVAAYESPSTSSMEAVSSDLEAIRDADDATYLVAQQVADTWNSVYLNPDYPLFVYDQTGTAAGLAATDIPNTATHAFVVLGYKLEDGEMTDELKGRCEAAAAAAQAYPETLLICTGGATGENNPDHHSEAGMMKSYLVETLGVAQERVYTDEEAQTTAENARNCLDIMRELGVNSMTIVTSSYHQRWAQVVFGAMRALVEQESGFSVENKANFCYMCEPSESTLLQDDRIAAMQVAGMLGVSPDDMTVMPETADTD